MSTSRYWFTNLYPMQKFLLEEFVLSCSYFRNIFSQNTSNMQFQLHFIQHYMLASIFIIYDVHYTIIFLVYRVSDFSVNLWVQKLKKALTNQENITGLHYSSRIWSFTRINRSDVNFVLSFILSSSYFLTISANLTFRIRLRLR